MNRSPLIGLNCNTEPESLLGSGRPIRGGRIVEVLSDGNLMIATRDGRLSVHKPIYVTITQSALLQDRLDFGWRADQMI